MVFILLGDTVMAGFRGRRGGGIEFLIMKMPSIYLRGGMTM
jgi:hypothetical protein